MATLRMGNRQQEIHNGAHFIEEAKELGVLFGCEHGLCGTCRIEVLEGIENLSERTPEEIALGCEGNIRQACQCRILKGTVVIRQF